MPRGTTLPALTGLRFLAAAHVVVYHALRPALVDAKPGLAAVTASGASAVTLFFVLSGFVLVHVYGPSVEVRAFWGARFARLAPLYWAALLLALPIGVIARARGVVSDELGPASLALVATGLQAWVPPAALRWNPPAWSLSCELFFYALFPVVARTLGRCTRRSALAVGAGAWLAGVALPLAYLAADPDGLGAPRITDESFWLNAVKLAPLARLPDFLVGVTAGVLFRNGARVPRGVGPVALAATLALAASGVAPALLLHNGLLAPLFALLVCWLAVDDGPLARVLSMRASLLLGEASYALYLLHVPLFLWAMALTRQTSLTPTRALLVGALALPVAVAAHLAIERPARMWLRRRLTGAAS